MNQGRIIVITGSPGTGKTTTASIVAKESDMDKSVHMHTDDFFLPTISRVIKQFKASITKKIGRPIWQKSFYEHCIRNRQDYDEIWRYIENNPLKYIMKKST